MPTTKDNAFSIAGTDEESDHSPQKISDNPLKDDLDDAFSKAGTDEESENPHTKDDDDAFSKAGADGESDHSPQEISNEYYTKKLSYRTAELLFPGLVISPRNNIDEEGVLVFYDNRGNISITSEIHDSQYQEAIQDFAKIHPVKTSALIKITNTPKCFEMDSHVQNIINTIKTHCIENKKDNDRKLYNITLPGIARFFSLNIGREKKIIDLNNQSNDLEKLIKFIDDINKLKYDPEFYLEELKDKIKSIKKIPHKEFITEIDKKLKEHKNQKKELYAITSQNNGWTATTILNKEKFKEIQEDNVKNNHSNQSSLLEFIAHEYKTIYPQTGTTQQQDEFYKLFEEAINSINNTDEEKYSNQAKKLEEIKDSYTQLTSDKDQAFLKGVFDSKFDDFDQLMKGDYSAYKKKQEAFKKTLETSLKKIDYSNYNYKEGIIENDDISSSCCPITKKTHGSPSISTKDYKKTHDSIYTQLPKFEEYLKDKKRDNSLSLKWGDPSFYRKTYKIKNSEKLIQSLKTALNSDNDDDNKLKISAIKEILNDSFLNDSYFKKNSDDLRLKNDLEMLKDYYSSKKDGKTSAESLILNTRRDKENLSIGDDSVFTICNKQGSKDFQLIINRDLLEGTQKEKHDNVFFKNIGKDKDGNNYYIRIFFAKGGETIYEDGKESNPSKTAKKGEIVFDKNTVWCAKSESQLHNDKATRISVEKTPKDIKDKFSKTNIIVLEAKDKEIIESDIFIGGSHSKITIPPSPSTDPQSAEPISPLTRSRA